MEHTKKLYRSCKDRMLGGVAGGLAEYFEVDSTLIRLLFILLLFSGIGIFAYIFAWIIVPEDPKCKSGKKPAEEMKEKADTIAQEIKGNLFTRGKDEKEHSDSVKIVFGVIILALGALLLVQNIVGINIWNLFWPLLLVVIGLFIIARK